MMLKRGFDIVLGATALILFLPVMMVLAMLVALTVGRPVLFRQQRSGLGGVDFELFKFRSMRDALGSDGRPLPDEERVTRLGRFLRRSRLDELPELLMVVGGTMSFVGPRPLPRETIEQYGVLETRSRVRPGLTGLAQVSGNTLLTNEEKFAIDCYYVAHQSVMGDMMILIDTIRTVINGEHRNNAIIERAMRYAINTNRSGR